MEVTKSDPTRCLTNIPNPHLPCDRYPCSGSQNFLVRKHTVIVFHAVFGLFLQVVFPKADFLPRQKLKELERYLPEKLEAEQPESMDDDLYIYADLEDCDFRNRKRYHHQDYYMEEDDCSGGVQCQTS